MFEDKKQDENVEQESLETQVQEMKNDSTIKLMQEAEELNIEQEPINEE